MTMALLCAFGVSYIGAFHKAEQVAYFVKAVEGKTIRVPASLSQEKHDLMAEGLRFHADHIRAIAAKIVDPEIREEYRAAAAKFEDAAHAIKTLTPLDHDMTFDKVREMVSLKVKKAELMGRILDLAGDQLNNEKLSALGEHERHWALNVKAALKAKKAERAACPAEVVVVQDGQYLQGDEGQDSDLNDDESSEESEEVQD